MFSYCGVVFIEFEYERFVMGKVRAVRKKRRSGWDDDKKLCLALMIAVRGRFERNQLLKREEAFLDSFLASTGDDSAPENLIKVETAPPAPSSLRSPILTL